MRISFAQYRHIRAKYARRAGKAELRGINNRSHPVEQKRPQERSVVVVAQPRSSERRSQARNNPCHGLAALKACRRAANKIHRNRLKPPRGSQFAKKQQKACDNLRRRPSWLLTAYIPGLRFRRSRFFPCRRSTRPRLPSSEPSRPHIPCRHTSYGRQRWFPYRARSRYRPRTAR